MESCGVSNSGVIGRRLLTEDSDKKAAINDNVLDAEHRLTGFDLLRHLVLDDDEQVSCGDKRRHLF